MLAQTTLVQIGPAGTVDRLAVNTGGGVLLLSGVISAGNSAQYLKNAKKFSSA